MCSAKFDIATVLACERHDSEEDSQAILKLYALRAEVAGPIVWNIL